MDRFSPEFSAFWLEESGQAQPGGRRTADRTADDEELSPTQQVALEELAERVNAARSIV